MITTVDEAVARLEEAFWRRYESSPDLQAKLAGKDRVIQLILTDARDEDHWFQVDDGRLVKSEVGVNPRANATITTTRADFLAIFNKELKPLQAYLTGRVKVKAGLGDILFAKSLLGA